MKGRSIGFRLAAWYFFVFACGAWLGKVFPELLASRIFPSRQEIFFFGLPAGATQFDEAHLPTWLYLADEFYGMPDIEHRGLKVANDRHGARVDPDTQSRIATPEARLPKISQRSNRPPPRPLKKTPALFPSWTRQSSRMASAAFTSTPGPVLPWTSHADSVARPWFNT